MTQAPKTNTNLFLVASGVLLAVALLAGGRYAISRSIAAAREQCHGEKDAAGNKKQVGVGLGG